MEENILVIENLYKEYITKKSTILANDNINLTIKKGEIVAFLGPNGAGKSTLVKQIIGYLSPTAGNIKLFGEDVRKQSKENLTKIGYMMQSRYEHWDHLSVKDALLYSGRLKKLTKVEVREQSKYLADRLELTDEMKRPIRSLSGGKRQTASLACSVIGNPEIIILDEPTNGLDPEKRHIFYSFLKELCSSRGVTIIIITHNVNEIEDIANRVIIIGGAKILRDGTPDELKAELRDQMRIELNLDENELWKDGCLAKNYSVVWSADKRKLYVYLSERESVTCIGDILNDKKVIGKVKNIQLYRPTLEDIYIKIMGEKIS